MFFRLMYKSFLIYFSLEISLINLNFNRKQNNKTFLYLRFFLILAYLDKLTLSKQTTFNSKNTIKTTEKLKRYYTNS